MADENMEMLHKHKNEEIDTRKKAADRQAMPDNPYALGYDDYLRAREYEREQRERQRRVSEQDGDEDRIVREANRRELLFGDYKTEKRMKDKTRPGHNSDYAANVLKSLLTGSEMVLLKDTKEIHDIADGILNLQDVLSRKMPAVKAKDGMIDTVAERELEESLKEAEKEIAEQMKKLQEAITRFGVKYGLEHPGLTGRLDSLSAQCDRDLDGLGDGIRAYREEMARNPELPDSPTWLDALKYLRTQKAKE